MISNGKKALVHVAKDRLGLSDAEYLDILFNHGDGAQSSRDLNPRTFEAVMDHFKALGFVHQPRKQGGYYKPPASKDALTRKVVALRDDLGVTDGYIDAIAQNMFKVSSYRWLDGGQLHRLVAALTYHQQRRGGSRRRAGACR